MALYKRSDSKFYWLEFTFAGQRYRVSTQSKRIGEARDFARHYRQQVYEEVKLGRKRHEPMRFQEAVKRYAATHLKTKARLAKTASCSAYVLAALVRWVGAETILDQIDTGMVAYLKEQIFDGGRRKPATVNKYLADLRAILRMAHLEWKRLGHLPRFKLFPLKNERTRWLRPEEEVRLLRACVEQPHIHDLIIFLVDTGARMGEACSLTWSDLLLPKRSKGTVMLFSTKTQALRSVPLTERCDRLVRRLHAERPDDQERVFLVRTPGGNWRGTIAQAKPFSNPHGAWKIAVKKADLLDVRLHDLRHTFASRLVQQNVPLLTVANLLGHSSTRMTMRYAHLATETLKDAIAKLDTKDVA